MNYQSFQNCVRAYFPRIRFYGKLIHLFPNDLTKCRHNNDAIVQLCEEFNLPYARILIRNFWKAQNLVIGYSDWTNAWDTVEHGGADYRYSFSGDTHVLETEEQLLRMLKLAHDSNCFHYNKVR